MKKHSQSIHCENGILTNFSAVLSVSLSLNPWWLVVNESYLPWSLIVIGLYWPYIFGLELLGILIDFPTE